MNIFKSYILVITIVFVNLFTSEKTLAQYGPNDTIRAEAIIINGDTVPLFWLPGVDYSQFIGTPARRREIDQLRAKVYKVYPYALEVKNILHKIDHDLGTNAKRRDRKKYLAALDAELNKRYKDELKELSTSQGQILVKLINRETGRDVYSLVKELKGGFNARMYQTAFKFFDNNLKMQYDPFGVDKDIEMIVKDFEQRYMNRRIAK